MAKLTNTEVQGVLAVSGNIETTEGSVIIPANGHLNLGYAKLSANSLTATTYFKLPTIAGTILVDDMVVAGDNITLTTDSTTGKITIAAAASSEGTKVEANPTTTTSDSDLSSIGIGGTNYNINATKMDGHDLDDLAAVINAKYVPDVTVDSMNTAIENKISEALAALDFNKYYTGTISPASDLGTDGDLYLQQ